MKTQLKKYETPVILCLEMDAEDMIMTSESLAYDDSEEDEDDARQTKLFTAPDGDSNWDDFGF